MSENVETPVYKNKPRTRILVLVLSALVLLVYGAGFIALPIRILTSYRDRVCDSVLSLHRLYIALYPKFMEDESLTAPVKECEVYVLASTSEKNAKWTDAYNAYEQYLSDYPGGIYAKTAYEHRAAVLIHVVEGLVDQEKYEEAIANLDLLLDQYADTDAAADAWILTPRVLTAWGTKLRESGDFETAVGVFNDFRSWAEHYQRNDAVLDAKRELAKTFVNWGLDLQSQGKYEDAIAKFEIAVNTDGSPESTAAEQNAYIEWGNAYLEQKDFSAAIKNFDLAVDLAVNNDDARDALSNGYVRWASDLETKEDFFGALKQLEMAKSSAATDAVKTSVDAAFSETYLAFANSDGDQAKQAMKNAMKAACEDGKKPNLPIFGVSKDTTRIGIYGVDVALPDDMQARTPAEMHTIACIVEVQNTIDSKIHIKSVQYPGGNYVWVMRFQDRYYVGVRETRIRLDWNIRLLSVNTLGEISDASLVGSMPAPFSKDASAVGSGVIYGKPPHIDLVLQWLYEALKET